MAHTMFLEGVFLTALVFSLVAASGQEWATQLTQARPDTGAQSNEAAADAAAIYRFTDSQIRDGHSYDIVPFDVLGPTVQVHDTPAGDNTDFAQQLPLSQSLQDTAANEPDWAVGRRMLFVRGASSRGVVRCPRCRLLTCSNSGTDAICTGFCRRGRRIIRCNDKRPQTLGFLAVGPPTQSFLQPPSGPSTGTAGPSTPTGIPPPEFGVA
eukprot:jgi/Ulvmu1/3487/UM161_0004.1